MQKRLLLEEGLVLKKRAIRGVPDLYIQAIQQTEEVPVGASGALLWFLLKGKEIEKHIQIPDGFVELWERKVHPISLSNIKSPAVLFAVVRTMSSEEREQCSNHQLALLLLWSLGKELDLPNWSEEAGWRLLLLLRFHSEKGLELKHKEKELVKNLGRSVRLELAYAGLLLEAEQLNDLKPPKEKIAFASLQRYANAILQSNARPAAVQLGKKLWKDLSNNNRERLVERYQDQQSVWKRLWRKMVGARRDLFSTKKPSHILELLCLEFEMLSDISSLERPER